MEKLASLTMEFNTDSSNNLTPRDVAELGPFLQGALMECIDRDFAESLHSLSFNPYSQYCRKDKNNGHIIWRVNTLNQKAESIIIDSLMSKTSFFLKTPGIEMNLVKSSRETLSLDQLLSNLYGSETFKYRIDFHTPTAFKVHGRYAFIPSVRLIFQNLLMHYNYVYSGDSEIDEEAVQFIDDKVIISAFNMRSQYFSHNSTEARGIPAFIGNITLNSKRAKSLNGLLLMLIRFAEYSGIGIKTAMGMGGCTTYEFKSNKGR